MVTTIGIVIDIGANSETLGMLPHGYLFYI